MVHFEIAVDKDTSKTPKFKRFADPPADIKLAVEDLRAAAAAKHATKRRSWAASFSLNKLSAKKPMFERFANPHGDIKAAVEEMRVAARTSRARQNRSWSAAFPIKKGVARAPQFDRFAKPPVDITVAVQEMRALAIARRAKKQRSWSATFSMGKNSSKVPAFERFVPQPVISVALSLYMSVSPDLSLSPNVSIGLSATHDIKSAVGEMRLAAAAKRASKQRSWSAAFSMNKISSKTPQHERFAYPTCGIMAAVEQMRLAAAAKRANKHRSWAATFSMNKVSSKTPQHERFATPTSDIKAAVHAMRLAAAAKRTNRHRSWSAAFSMNKVSSKAPQHERFAFPTCGIMAAVEQMRLAAAANRARKQRSWSTSVSFNQISSKIPMFRRFANDQRDIKEAVEEMRAAMAAHRASKHRSWSASYSMNKISSKTPLHERFASQPNDIKAVVEQMRLLAAATRTKKPRSWSASFPMNKILSKTPKFDRFASPPSDIRLAVEDMRLAAIQTRAMKREAAAKKEEAHAAEVDSLIQEEQIRKLSEEWTAQHEIEQNEKLVDEELNIAFGEKQQTELPLSTINTMPSYLAGSAASAVRKMRRSASVSTFQMDADDDKPSRPVRESSLARVYNACGAELYQLDFEESDGSAGYKNGGTRSGERSRATNIDNGNRGSKITPRSTSVRSAMAMDLSSDSASCTSKVPGAMQRSMMSKSPSDGYLTRGNPTPLMPLLPYVMPKSTSFLAPVASTKVGPGFAKRTGSGASAWNVDNNSFPLSAHVSGHLAWDTRTRFGAVS